MKVLLTRRRTKTTIESPDFFVPCLRRRVKQNSRYARINYRIPIPTKANYARTNTVRSPAFIRGIGGAALALPVLDAMGREVSEQLPRRFCAMYTANGMSLPRPEHGIDEWSWFPRAEKDGQFVFGKSTEPLASFAISSAFSADSIIQTARRPTRTSALICG